MVLTELAVKSIKSRAKAYKLFDERGLYFLIAPTGGRLWRFKYFHQDREKLVSLGRYPDVSLKLARDRRDEARRQVAEKVDPAAERKAAKRERDNSVRRVAEEWLQQQRKTLHVTRWHAFEIVSRTGFILQWRRERFRISKLTIY